MHCFVSSPGDNCLGTSVAVQLIDSCKLGGVPCVRTECDFKTPRTANAPWECNHWYHRLPRLYLGRIPWEDPFPNMQEVVPCNDC